MPGMDRQTIIVSLASSDQAEMVSETLGEDARVIPAPARDLEEVVRQEGASAVLMDAAAFRSLCSMLRQTSDHALLGAVGEGICVASADGSIVWSNDRFLGLDRATRDRAAACCKEAATSFSVADSGVVGRKFTIEGGDGRHYELIASPVFPPESESDEATQVIAVLWDITRSQRARRKIDAIDRAGAELVKLDVHVVSELNATERLKLLEDKIVRFAHDLLRFDHFTIHLLDERTNRLELVMSRGLPEAVKHMDLYAAPEGSGITGHVAATGRSYLCPDVRYDERYIQGIENASSALTVPLLLHDKLIGVFNVESDEPNAFTQEDRQFLEIFARYVALAFHFLDILVVERYTTNEAISGRVEGEINEPLEDLLNEAKWLREQAGGDDAARKHADQIVADVESIRRRMKEVAAGPRSILGAEFVLSESAEDPLISGRRVLVVDDEPAIRETIRDVITRRGGVVVVCPSGAQACEALDAWSEGGSAFDLVISDIHMPDRNGYEVYSCAKGASDEVPVILMTGFGYDPHHSIVRASEEGLQCVLFKPFRAQQLLEEMYKAFGATEEAGG